jgi:hypothetical protein
MKETYSEDRDQTKGRSPRTLIFSQRNLTSIQPFRCAHFEFEDVIAEIDEAEFVAAAFNTNTL